jgi:hypothetical protein
MMQHSGLEELPLPSASRSSTPTSKVSTILQKTSLLILFRQNDDAKKKFKTPILHCTALGHLLSFVIYFQISCPNGNVITM